MPIQRTVLAVIEYTICIRAMNDRSQTTILTYHHLILTVK